MFINLLDKNVPLNQQIREIIQQKSSESYS